MSRKYIPNFLTAAFAISGVLLVASGLSDLSNSKVTVASQKSAVSANAGIQYSPKVSLTKKRVSNDFDSTSVIESQREDLHRSHQKHDEEFQQDHTVVELDSVEALMSHLEGTPEDLVDFDSVVNLINESEAAFNYIVGEYLATNEAREQRVLLNAINNTSNPARVNFALELANSADLQQRRSAYLWLSRSAATSEDDLIYQTLVDASYHEHDANTLSQLVSSLPLSGFSPTSNIRERAISRLNELAFHPDEDVSSKAIAKISNSAINQNTLSILQSHLQDDSENRQLAALEGLRNFDKPNGEVMSSLNAILHNPNLPQKNRAIAARILIDFENELYPPERL